MQIIFTELPNLLWKWELLLLGYLIGLISGDVEPFSDSLLERFRARLELPSGSESCWKESGLQEQTANLGMSRF